MFLTSCGKYCAISKTKGHSKYCREAKNIVPKSKHKQNICKHPSQKIVTNIYKIYKNMLYCLLYSPFLHILFLIFYQGLHTESELTGGATGDM